MPGPSEDLRCASGLNGPIDSTKRHTSRRAMIHNHTESQAGHGGGALHRKLWNPGGRTEQAGRRHAEVQERQPRARIIPFACQLEPDQGPRRSTGQRSSVVEQRFCKPQVDGSNPSVGSGTFDSG